VDHTTGTRPTNHEQACRHNKKSSRRRELRDEKNKKMKGRRRIMFLCYLNVRPPNSPPYTVELAARGSVCIGGSATG
jgi:hypothetical protein